MITMEKLGVLIAAAAASWLNNDITVPVLGVQVTAIGTAVLGVLAAFAISDPSESRKEFFAYIFGFGFVGSIVAALAPHWGWDWAVEVRAPLAGAVSFGATILLRPIINRLKELIKTYTLELKFLRGKKDGES